MGLWEFDLPLKITCVIVVAMIIVLTALAPRWKWKRRWALLASVPLGVVVSLPMFAIVHEVVAWKRFGVFHHADAQALTTEGYLRYYLPPKATDITVNHRSIGHEARYSISEADWRAFVDEVWARKGRPQEDRDRADRQMLEDDSMYRERLTKMGWSLSKQTQQMAGPMFGDYSMFYYDRATGTAFQSVTYW
jgi:hypothetical protein